MDIREKTDWREFLAGDDKYLISSYVAFAGSHSENTFSYVNEGEIGDDLCGVFLSKAGALVAGPLRLSVAPHATAIINAGAYLRNAGKNNFEGSLLLIVRSRNSAPIEASFGRDLKCAWSSERATCLIATDGYRKLNIIGKKEKQSYFMFCPAVVLTPELTTKVVVVNHSSAADYSDAITLKPTLYNLEGEALEGQEVTMPPFGSAVFDLDTYFGVSGRELLARTDGRGALTTMHYGHILISFYFHIDRMGDAIVSGSHTQPPIGIFTRLNYRPWVNFIGAKLPFIGYASILKGFLRRK